MATGPFLQTLTNVTKNTRESVTNAMGGEQSVEQLNNMSEAAQNVMSDITMLADKMAQLDNSGNSFKSILTMLTNIANGTKTATQAIFEFSRETKNINPDLFAQVAEDINKIQTNSRSTSRELMQLSSSFGSVTEQAKEAKKAIEGLDVIDFTNIKSQLSNLARQHQDLTVDILKSNQNLSKGTLDNITNTTRALQQQIKDINTSMENIRKEGERTGGNVSQNVVDLFKQQINGLLQQSQSNNITNNILKGRTAANEETFRTATQETRARQHLIEELMSETLNLKEQLGDEEVRKILKELTGEFNNLDKTLKNSERKLTFADHLENAGKKFDNFLNKDLPNMGNGLKNFVNQIDNYTAAIKTLATSLPSGNSAQWLQNTGFSGSVAGGLNTVIQSGIGQTGLGFVDNLFGTKLTDANFLASDMNGAVMNLMYNPDQLWGKVGISGVTKDELWTNGLKYAKEEEQLLVNNLMSATQRGFGTSVDSLRGLTTQGEDLYSLSNGLINYDALSKSYDTFSKSARNTKDAQAFAEYSVLAEKTKGLDQGTVIQMMETYYKNLGMSVNETVTAIEKMHKLSLNSGLPFSELTKALSSVAEKFRQIGMSAQTAENTLTNFVNMGYQMKEAEDLANATGNALSSFSKKDSDVVMAGILQGQANPFTSLFQAADVMDPNWATNMARGVDSMLNMTRGLFGNNDMGNWQILKQLQGYGYTQKQASEMFREWNKGTSIESLLQGYKTSDDAVVDIDKSVSDMKDTIADIGQQLGPIATSNAEAQEVAMGLSTNISKLAGTVSQNALTVALNYNAESARKDADAINDSLKDGVLNNVFKNYDTPLNDIKNLLTTISQNVLTMTLLNGVGTGINVAAKLGSKGLQFLGQFLTPGDGSVFGLGGGSGKTIEGLSGVWGGQTQTAGAILGNIAGGTAIGGLVAKAGDFTIDRLKEAGVDVGSLDDENIALGRDIATTVAGALGGYLGGPGGAVVASTIASGLSVGVTAFFDWVADKMGYTDTQTDYEKEHPINDATFNARDVFAKNTELFANLGLTEANAFQIADNEGHTNFDLVMRSRGDSVFGTTFLPVGKTVNGGFFDRITLNDQETRLLDSIQSDYKFAQSQSGLTAKEFADKQRYSLPTTKQSQTIAQILLQAQDNRKDINGNSILNDDLQRDALLTRNGKQAFYASKLSYTDNKLMYGNALISPDSLSKDYYDALVNFTKQSQNTADETKENTDKTKENTEALKENTKAKNTPTTTPTTPTLTLPTLTEEEKDFKQKISGRTFDEILKAMGYTEAEVFNENQTSTTVNLSNIVQQYEQAKKQNNKLDAASWLKSQGYDSNSPLVKYLTQRGKIQLTNKDGNREEQLFDTEGGPQTALDKLLEDKGDIANAQKILYNDIIKQQLTGADLGTAFSLNNIIGDNGENLSIRGIKDDTNSYTFKAVNSKGENVYETSGSYDKIEQWINKQTNNENMQFNLMTQAITDVKQVAEGIQEDTEDINEKTPDPNQDKLEGWLGQGQLILTNTALHSSSYLNNDASSTTDWKTIRANIENAGGGIGYAYDSEGQSRAMYMNSFGGNDYQSKIETVQTYGNRGGVFNANFNFVGTPQKWTEEMMGIANEGINKTGVANYMTTRVQTTTPA